MGQSFQRTPEQEEGWREIGLLRENPKFVPSLLVGGVVPDCVYEDNRRKKQALRKEELLIVGKYGLYEEYRAVLKDEYDRLEKDLQDSREGIGALDEFRDRF